MRTPEWLTGANRREIGQMSEGRLSYRGKCPGDCLGFGYVAGDGVLDGSTRCADGIPDIRPPVIPLGRTPPNASSKD